MARVTRRERFECNCATGETRLSGGERATLSAGLSFVSVCQLCARIRIRIRMYLYLYLPSSIYQHSSDTTDSLFVLTRDSIPLFSHQFYKDWLWAVWSTALCIWLLKNVCLNFWIASVAGLYKNICIECYGLSLIILRCDAKTLRHFCLSLSHSALRRALLSPARRGRSCRYFYTCHAVVFDFFAVFLEKRVGLLPFAHCVSSPHPSY